MIVGETGLDFVGSRLKQLLQARRTVLRLAFSTSQATVNLWVRSSDFSQHIHSRIPCSEEIEPFIERVSTKRLAILGVAWGVSNTKTCCL